MDEAQEMRGVFIESGEDSAEVFELSNITFYVPAFFIQRIIAFLRFFPILLGWNDGCGARVPDRDQIGIGVKSTIRQYMPWRYALQETRKYRRFRSLPWRQNEFQGIA